MNKSNLTGRVRRQGRTGLLCEPVVIAPYIIIAPPRPHVDIVGKTKQLATGAEVDVVTADGGWLEVSNEHGLCGWIPEAFTVAL